MSEHAEEGTYPSRRRSAIAQYLAVVRRRRWAILVSIVVPLLVTIGLSVSQEASFEGTASVVLNRQSLANSVTNTPDPTAQANDYIRIVQTQAELARSPSVASRALAGTGVKLTPAAFLKASSVEPGRDADVLIFKVDSHDREVARKLSNSYARAYVQFRLLVDTTALKEAGDEVASRIRDLQADPDRNARIIQSLQSRQQELETLQALQTAKATVVYSTVPPAQVAPALKRNIALGIVAGIVLAIIVAGLFEALDTRVRSSEEVDDYMNGTLLGRLGPPPADATGLVMAEHPGSPEAEAFRVLQTNLRFAAIDRSINSLMVTSSVQGEGKSTTIGNLALALARSGQRVVLVDLDLRRPATRKLFGLPSGPGMTDVLLGNASLEESLVAFDLKQAETSNGEGSLRILGAGTPPPNPGELVGPTGGVARLIRELESDSDLVLVDAPPALVVGDALALSAIVDGVFLCVRLKVVTRGMLTEISQVLESAHTNVLGYVVTGQTRGNGGYGYGYSYGYSAPAPTSSARS